MFIVLCFVNQSMLFVYFATYICLFVYVFLPFFRCLLLCFLVWQIAFVLMCCIALCLLDPCDSLFLHCDLNLIRPVFLVVMWKLFFGCCFLYCF